MAELRAEKGWTQERLAEALDQWPRWVQELEAGRANVSIRRLVELANVLGVHPVELLRPPRSRAPRRPGRPARG